MNCTRVGDVEVAVRHTFLVVPEHAEEAFAPRRSASVPPPSGSCDRDVQLLHALTYKTKPVESPMGKATDADQMRRRWMEEAPSESTAVPDADSVSEANSANSASDATCAARTVVATAVVVSTAPPVPTSPAAGVLRLLSLSPEQPVAQAMHSGTTGAEVPVADEALLQQVPLDEKGEYTSIGSSDHYQGTCKPCVFAHHAEKSCANGVACPFCHFEHAPKRRMRLRKQRRLELRHDGGTQPIADAEPAWEWRGA